VFPRHKVPEAWFKSINATSQPDRHKFVSTIEHYPLSVEHSALSLNFIDKLQLQWELFFWVTMNDTQCCTNKWIRWRFCKRVMKMWFMETWRNRFEIDCFIEMYCMSCMLWRVYDACTSKSSSKILLLENDAPLYPPRETAI
jgi:hypothetical protein